MIFCLRNFQFCFKKKLYCCLLILSVVFELFSVGGEIEKKSLRIAKKPSFKGKDTGSRRETHRVSTRNSPSLTDKLTDLYLKSCIFYREIYSFLHIVAVLYAFLLAGCSAFTKCAVSKNGLFLSFWFIYFEYDFKLLFLYDALLSLNRAANASVFPQIFKRLLLLYFSCFGRLFVIVLPG